MMAEGGENPKVDLKTFWPDKDVEFMIEMLRATGRYEVVPLGSQAPRWAPVVAGGMWMDPFCLRGGSGD